MSTFNFRKQLEDQVISLTQTSVGVGTDPVNYVKTFDRYLHDIDIQDYPFIVVVVKQVEQVGPGEMGTLRELNMWDVVIYYLDITKPGEFFADGEARRDNICTTIQYALELNPRLDNLRVELEDSGLSQYVYDSNFSTILFDASGQEDYFTFVAEMNLSVNTAKN